MEKNLLVVMIWLLFLGGLFGLVMGLSLFFRGGAPAQYGVMGIGGGFWFLSSAIAIYVKGQLSKP
jgi:hypothetical protein